jgi:hypothetical protein
MYQGAALRFLTALLAGLSLLVSGCGGGGGGGAGGGGGSNDAYTLSATSVAFTANQGGATPAAQTVDVTVLSGTVFIATSQIGIGFSHSFVLTGPNTGRVTITPDPPNGAGNFSGTITVRGCATQICGSNDVPGTISPDGGRLFLAGNDQLIIVPAP